MLGQLQALRLSVIKAQVIDERGNGVSRELMLVSVEDGASLRLSCPDENWGAITVEARGQGFSVSAPAYVDLAPSLPQFLADLESAGTTSEPLTWQTLEGDLKLEARRDPLGHVFVTYHLRSPDIGSDRWWSFTGRLVLELGALQDLRKSAGRFWAAAR